MVGAIILAAGLSTRMKINKLLLPLGNKTVIEHSVGNLLASRADKVVVVLGYQAQKVKKVLSRWPLKFVINENFRKGQSTSIIRGLEALNHGVEAILFCLGDQPFIPPALINRLICQFQKNGPLIVYPEYKGQRGNPVLFGSKLLPALLQVEGDQGCRSIIMNTKQTCALQTRSFGVCFDIDGPGDLERAKVLLSSYRLKGEGYDDGL